MQYPQINIIVPLYNEQQVFPVLTQRLRNLIKNSEVSIEVIMIDDGSSDETPDLMKKLSMSDASFTSLFLSRNFGHQLALSAALSYVNATEAVMIIDGDLQDPPELLHDFYAKYKKGYDVVYAVRTNRKENFIKKFSYRYFYKILRKISYSEIPLDSGDFSLISRRVVNKLNQMPEQSRFIRGMRGWLGYKQIGLEYERSARKNGESKYSLKKLIELALNGIFNFSEYPIKVLVRMGLIAVIISLIYLIYTLIMKFLFNDVPGGFTALLFVIILFGGIQLIALGVLGEYILRIFFQVKNRPLFVIKESIRGKELNNE